MKIGVLGCTPLQLPVTSNISKAFKKGCQRRERREGRVQQRCAPRGAQSLSSHFSFFPLFSPLPPSFASYSPCLCSLRSHLFSLAALTSSEMRAPRGAQSLSSPFSFFLLFSPLLIHRVRSRCARRARCARIYCRSLRSPR